MKIVIDIPKEFESHYDMDKFNDSLCRIAADMMYCWTKIASGRYEQETLSILINAFKNSKELVELDELSVLACKYAIANMIETGSVQYAHRYNGEWKTIEWLKVVDNLVDVYNQEVGDK